MGIEAELIEGDNGIFEVAVDGNLVFSKQASGEFIATQDMVRLVKEHLEGSKK
jgi:selT/selW/selH-like putative selenoprotein